jgi:hypothetical protein
MVMVSFLPEEDPMILPGVTYLTFPVQKTNTPHPPKADTLQAPDPKIQNMYPQITQISQIQIQKNS